MEFSPGRCEHDVRDAFPKSFGDEFLRLERSGIQLLTPEEFRSAKGTQFSSRVDAIRRELGDELPDQPTAFARETRRSIKLDIKRAVHHALERPVDE